MKKSFVVFVLSCVLFLTGCASVSSALSRVNWYKIGANACFKLSDKLNEKAEEKQKEIDEMEKEEVVK